MNSLTVKASDELKKVYGDTLVVIYILTQMWRHSMYHSKTFFLPNIVFFFILYGQSEHFEMVFLNCPIRVFCYNLKH